MMSLLALSLVVGILLNDSIVVIENMYHHLERGKTKRQAAIDGCRQIMFTVVAITFVIVVVFLSLTIIEGWVGNLLREFSIPIITATLTSLLVSFTVTPLLMSRFGKLSDETRPTLSIRFSRSVEKIFESLKIFYARIDFTTHIRSKQNMDTFHALIEARKERLRPILMTTFAMIFGMLPIALASGNGAELKNGMAWVIIDGLTSSMILTLVVVVVVLLLCGQGKSAIQQHQKYKFLTCIIHTKWKKWTNRKERKKFRKGRKYRRLFFANLAYPLQPFR